MVYIWINIFCLYNNKITNLHKNISFERYNIENMYIPESHRELTIKEVKGEKLYNNKVQSKKNLLYWKDVNNIFRTHTPAPQNTKEHTP